MLGKPFSLTRSQHLGLWASSVRRRKWQALTRSSEGEVVVGVTGEGRAGGKGLAGGLGWGHAASSTILTCLSPATHISK